MAPASPRVGAHVEPLTQALVTPPEARLPSIMRMAGASHGKVVVALDVGLDVMDDLPRSRHGSRSEALLQT